MNETVNLEMYFTRKITSSFSSEICSLQFHFPLFCLRFGGTLLLSVLSCELLLIWWGDYLFTSLLLWWFVYCWLLLFWVSLFLFIFFLSFFPIIIFSVVPLLVCFFLLVTCFHYSHLHFLSISIFVSLLLMCWGLITP